MKLMSPYNQYEGKWFTSLPPIAGHKYARIFIVRFVKETHHGSHGYQPGVEAIYIPQDHPADYLNFISLTGEYEEYEPTEDDFRGSIHSVFERPLK